MNEEEAERLFLRAVRQELQLERRDPLSQDLDWFVPCLGLQQLSAAKKHLAFKSVVSFAEEVVLATRADFSYQEPDRRFVRILIFMLLHIDNDSTRLDALNHMKDTLNQMKERFEHPLFLGTRKLEPGQCDCFNVLFSGDFQCPCPGIDMEQRVLSALHLIGIVPRIWQEVVLVALNYSLENSYAWINCSAPIFPETFWTWTSATLDSVLQPYASAAMQITFILCLNHSFAREAIRRGVFDKCLDAFIVHRLSESLPHPDYSWALCGGPMTRVYPNWQTSFLTKHLSCQNAANILCIIATLELPEVSSRHRSKMLKVALNCCKWQGLRGGVRLRHQLSLAFISNPKFRSCIRHNAGLGDRLGRLVPTWSLQHSMDSAAILFRMQMSVKMAERHISACSADMEAFYAERLLESLCDDKISNLSCIMLRDSMLRSLCKHRTRINKLSLLHILTERNGCVWWLGVLKRAEVDLKDVRDSMQRTPVMLADLNSGLRLSSGLQLQTGMILATEVDLSVRDENGQTFLEAVQFEAFIGAHHREGVYSPFGVSWSKVFAERGLFDTVKRASILYAYHTASCIPRELFREVARLIWISPARFPRSNHELIQILRKRHLSVTRTLNPLYPCFLFRASLICSIFVMKTRLRSKKASLRRSPISLFSLDTIKILLLEYIPLPNLEQQALIPMDELCFRF